MNQFPPDVNFASADAQVEPTPPEQTSVRNKTSSNKYLANKSLSHLSSKSKPRFKSNRFKQSRRGGVSYSKNLPKTSLNIVPRRKTFTVFVSNTGCLELGRITFDVIRGKDFRLAHNITLEQLQYVLNIAVLNRMVQVSIINGYAFPLEASRLKQISSGILLPDILATYVESIGTVELPSGAVVGPYIADYADFFGHHPQLLVDPAAILIEAERPIPHGDWALDIAWIVEFNDATTRASRSGMKFRRVNNDDLTGKNEMVVSYVPIDTMLLPKAPNVMTEAEAQLGACYRFRNYAERDFWLGDSAELLFDAFTAIPFEPEVVYSDACVAAFAGSEVKIN